MGRTSGIMGGTDQPVGTRLVLPIVAVFFSCLIAVIALVGLMSQESDEISAAREASLIAAALGDLAVDLGAEVEAFAVSDEAVRRVGNRREADWIHQALMRTRPSAVAPATTPSVYLVLDPQDRPAFGLLASRPATEAALAGAWPGLAPDLGPLVTAARGTYGLRHGAADGMPPKATVAGFATVDGKPSIAVAVAISSDSGRLAPAPRALSVAVAVRPIDAAITEALARPLLIENLRFAAPGSPAEGPAVPIRTIGGGEIGRLVWSPQQVGAEMRRRALPFISALGIVSMLFVSAILIYLRQTAKALRERERHAHDLARRDTLTGLANRRRFLEVVDEAFSQRRDRETIGVLYIDLDRFKAVNDTLGHEAGDQLLVEVVKRFTAALPAEATMARMGGDEFAVLVHDPLTRGVLHKIAEAIVGSLSRGIVVKGHVVSIGASVGYAFAPTDGLDPQDLMRKADIALFVAKGRGRGQACSFVDSMEDEVRERREIETDLRHALARGELKVAYQPFFSADGETMVGVEALVRWTHPVKGPISPASFIPIAEETGLIVPLGAFVLERACRDAARWPDLIVAANLSTVQVERDDFLHTLDDVLARTRMSPARLELEITESVLLADASGTLERIRKIKTRGVRVALDDFGTGYSSLGYLQRFPFDKLKIDQSFVRGLDKSADAAAIIHCVVGLGRALGMEVQAEGVETADHHRFLRAAGCHMMQGYLFAKPMPAEAIDRLIAERAPPAPEAAADAA